MQQREERARVAESNQPITVNRQAYHDYFVEETYEAGIELRGTEVKSVRGGKVNLRGSFARVRDPREGRGGPREGRAAQGAAGGGKKRPQQAPAPHEEIWLEGAHIAEYEQGTYMNHDPMRPRRLLLHRAEIERLMARVEQKGLTLVPLRMYFKHNRVKVELGLCRGKKLYDKREDIKKRETQRELARVVKEHVRG